VLRQERSPVRNISPETNPNRLREDLLAMLGRQGADRLSEEVKTFDHSLLRQMGCHQAYGSGAEIQGRSGTLNIELLGQDMGSMQLDLGLVLEPPGLDRVSYLPPDERALDPA